MGSLEAMRTLIAFAAHIEFKLINLYVKSAFLNGYLNKEVYIKKILGFKDVNYSFHEFKLDKAIYGLI